MGRGRRLPPNAGKGRPKGIPNKASGEVKILARDLLSDPIYLANLRKRLRSGKIAPAVETTLYHYAFGKPSENVTLGLSRRLEDILDGSREPDA